MSNKAKQWWPSTLYSEPAKIVNNTPATLTLYVGGTPFQNGAIPPGGQLKLNADILEQGVSLVSDYPGLILDSVPEGWTQTVSAANTQFQKTGKGSSVVTFVSNDVRLQVDNSTSEGFRPTRYSTKSSGWAGGIGWFSQYMDAPTAWRGEKTLNSFYCYVAVGEGFSLDGNLGRELSVTGVQDVSLRNTNPLDGYSCSITGPNPILKVVSS